MMRVPGLACALAITLQLNFGLAVATASTEARVESTPTNGSENPSQPKEKSTQETSSPSTAATQEEPDCD